MNQIATARAAMPGARVYTNAVTVDITCARCGRRIFRAEYADPWLTAATDAYAAHTCQTGD